MINDLPTIFEVVTGNVKQPKDQSGAHNNSSKSKSSGKVRRNCNNFSLFHYLFNVVFHSLLISWYLISCVLKHSRQTESQTKGVKMSTPPPKDDDESGEEEEEDDEQGATCGACGDNYGADEFWICCDVCERWFHGKCVKITPAKAEHIKQYKCPGCSSKRARV